MICVVFETQFLLSTQTREISHYKANELLAPFRNLSCYLIFGGREGRKRTNVLSENLLIQFTRKFNLVGLLELKIKAAYFCRSLFVGPCKIEATIVLTQTYFMRVTTFD